MNKNFKIIHINGFSGLIAVFFIAICLFGGFVAFPIWGIKAAWNFGLVPYTKLPSIGLFQAFLLWAFITLSLVSIFKNKISIKISNEEVLHDPELKNILQTTKKQSASKQSENAATEEDTEHEVIK